ncbi:secretory lipase-domain-containing protein [Aspergillus minisclerotigenes]|uniref:Secretory lipase-domain-containing protein n=1 Tax=Aspergillus minisclerotigenes TaxID=656917 RepID=A0A5N6JAA9_9EURO|nr:secretory lipase-domain-containing protein [Aspergillus minisclerotigenes]
MNAAVFDCLPSYYFVADGVEMGEYDSIVILIHHIAITAALNQGWIVTLHDHEGLDASFMANRRGAHAVLDDIRATLRCSNFTDVDRDAAVVMMGYPGGSSPTTLAAELKSAYAPELNIIGVAFEKFHPMCSEQLRSTLGYEEIASYFHSMEFLNSPDVQEIFSNNSLGQDASPTVDADNLVSWYCKKGVRIDYRLQTQESRRSLGIYGFWQGLAWAKERFDGLAMPEGCQNSTDYFANTDFDSIAFLGETAVGAIERQLGIDLPSLII